MYKVKVFITLKESVIDPQGSAAHGTLKELNYSEIDNIRIGKYIELTLNKEAGNVEARVKEMCEGLLVNTEVEEYRFEIEEVIS